MRLQLSMGLLAFLFAAAARGAEPNELPAEPKAILEKSEKFELFSLDPAAGDKNKDGFHGWKILGATIIKDADVRARIVAALEKGVENGPANGAKCFDPRHGIRVTKDNKTVDFVICFECRYVAVFAADKHLKTCLTTDDPQPVFDTVLKEAKVPLPKPAGK